MRDGARSSGARTLCVASTATAGIQQRRTAVDRCHPDAVARFTAAIRDAAIFANRRPSPPEATKILAKYTKVPVAMVTRLQMTPENDTTLSIAHVQPVIDTVKCARSPKAGR
jgi:ABC-type nitrate/sulfonate/bicarbonate transport system substrate-binding protein